MAGLCGGAICYGVYPTCSVTEVEYQLRNGRAGLFFAENQEFVDKVLQAAEPLPDLRKIIVFDTGATFQYDDPRLVSFADVLELGRARLQGRSGFLEERVAAVKPEDIAVLVYTSGTTGPPKGAMHDHSTLMWGFGNSYLEAFPELNTGVHRAISHLPIAHLIERSMSLYLPLVADVIPHAGEEVEDLRSTSCPASSRKWPRASSPACTAAAGSSARSSTRPTTSARATGRRAGTARSPLSG
jgi:long-chain acyl-CoA synthetase